MMDDKSSAPRGFSEDGEKDSSASNQAGVTEYSCAHPPTQESTKDQAFGAPISPPIVNEAVTRSLFRTLLGKAEELAATFNSGEATGDTFVEEIYRTLGDVCKLMEATDHHLQETLADLAGVEMAKAVVVLCEFMKNVYCRLNVGIDTRLVASFLKIRLILADLADVSSKMRTTLLNLGMVETIATELYELKESLEVDEVFKLLLVSTFGLLQSCVKDSKSYVQVRRARLLETLQPYLRCPFDEIRMSAKFTLASLHPCLSSKVLDYLEVTETELHQIVNGLKTVVSSGGTSVSCFGSEYSVLELLRNVSYLMVAPTTNKTLMKLGFLTVLRILLEKGNFLEQKMALKVFWLLLDEDFVREQLDSEEGVQSIELVAAVQQSGDPELQLLSSSIMWTISPPVDTDVPSLLSFAEGCYSYDRFEECVSECDKIKWHPQASLLKAKASFQIYRTEQHCIKTSLMQPKEFHQKHTACCKKAKDVIALFGSLLDSGHIDENHECSKLLDLAMIDYLQGTNNLRDCGRCLLCRKRAKLKRSHMWPKSLLDAFVSSESPKTRKVFVVSWKKRVLLHSPKEVTFWMLCSECESLLSGYGESQFMPEFFRKIYDAKDPEQSKKQQSIPYKEWLYQFCIGLVFRGLVQRNMDGFTNEEQIYTLLANCRRCLLNMTALDKVADVNRPDVAIIINPVEPRSVDQGLAHQLLHMAALFAVEEFELGSGCLSPGPEAQFFVAHFGIISLLVPFKQRRALSPYFINPSGGTFVVPDDMAREIPLGLWFFFEHLAQDFETYWLQRPAKLAQSMQHHTQRSTELPPETEDLEMVKQTDEFVDAVGEDLKLLQLTPSKLVGNPKIINFLPRQFKIHRMANQASFVAVPEGHRILLHATFKFDLKSKVSEDTFFLAVRRHDKDAKNDKDDGFSYNNPYILYLRYEENLQIQAGFFISVDSLSAGDFLPDDEPKHAISSVAAINEIKDLMPRLLPHIVNEKGFPTFQSLLKRIKVQRELPTVDMKCENRCWYCINACDYCLKPASLGYDVKCSQGTPSRFCSDACQSVFHQRFTTPKLAIKPLSSDVVDRSCKEDRDLLQLQFNCTNPAGINFEIKMNLCSGDKDTQPYLLYHLRTLLKQEFVEFFVNQDLTPAEPLPYLPKEYSASFSDLYTYLLKEALQTKECQHIRAIFKDSFQPKATSVQLENEHHGKDTGKESHKQQGLGASQESDERDPEKEEAYLLRVQGNAALKAGKIDKAVEFYSQGLERNPNDHVLYSNRSAAYLRSKEFQAALADAKKCTELKPDWSKAYFRKGQALYSLGQYSQAEEEYLKALKCEPGNEELEMRLKKARDAKSKLDSSLAEQ